MRGDRLQVTNWPKLSSAEKKQRWDPLVIPSAIHTAAILSAGIHLRQSAFRSFMTSSRRLSGITKIGVLGDRDLIKLSETR
jgi:hypothetical protein